ncbi:unnamed protein product, partial [Musa acuminata subsp. burmannicoides]
MAEEAQMSPSNEIKVRSTSRFFLLNPESTTCQISCLVLLPQKDTLPRRIIQSTSFSLILTMTAHKQF